MLVIFNHLITSFFTAKNLSKGKGFFKFFQIFNIRFFYAFIFIRKKFNKKTFIIEGSDVNIFFKDNKETSLSIVNDLNTKGYHDKLQLDEFNLKRIYNEISLKNSSISFKGQKRIDEKTLSLNNSSNLDDIVKNSKNYNLSHVSLDIDLKKTNYLKDIASSKLLLSMAKNYIGKNEISISSLCYISNPANISEEEKKDNAQYFHYDNDFKKFLKVFIYLNDVDLNSGPHSFVQFSHNRRLFKHLVSKRINDEEIISHYGKENIKTFSLSRGSLIFEDTFGLHKGNPPVKNTRTVLILVYGDNEGIGIYKNSLII